MNELRVAMRCDRAVCSTSPSSLFSQCGHVVSSFMHFSSWQTEASARTSDLACCQSRRTNWNMALFHLHKRSFHNNKNRGMSASPSGLVGVQFVDKLDTRSESLRYFAYISVSQEKTAGTTRPVCKRCFKPAHVKLTRPTPDKPTFQGIQRVPVSYCDR